MRHRKNASPPFDFFGGLRDARILVVALLALPGCDDVTRGAAAGPVQIEVTEAPVTVDDPDLVHVGDLRVDREDRTWVLTRYPPLVRVYDAEGHRVGAFGELGGGPGEFGSAWALVKDRGEGVGVVDNRRGVLRRYDADGVILSERPIGGEVSLPVDIRAVYFGDLGWTWGVEGGLVQDRYPPPPEGRPLQMQQPYDFWAADLVFLPDDGGEPRTIASASELAGVRMDGPPLPRPLSAGPLWDLCPDDEFVVHTGAGSDVVRLGLDGEVRSRTPIELPMGPPDRTILTEWLVSVISGIEPMEGDSPDALRERAAMVAEVAEPHLEPSLPPTRLRCDFAGRVWIQLFDLEHDRRGYARDWVVLEGEAVVAVVTFPEAFHPMRFGPERTIGVIRDEVDVETVGWVPTPTLP